MRAINNNRLSLSKVVDTQQSSFIISVIIRSKVDVTYPRGRGLGLGDPSDYNLVPYYQRVV